MEISPPPIFCSALYTLPVYFSSHRMQYNVNWLTISFFTFLLTQNRMISNTDSIASGFSIQGAALSNTSTTPTTRSAGVTLNRHPYRHINPKVSPNEDCGQGHILCGPKVETEWLKGPRRHLGLCKSPGSGGVAIMDRKFGCGLSLGWCWGLGLWLIVTWVVLSPERVWVMVTWMGAFMGDVPITTNFSQNVTEPSRGISYPVDDLCRCFTKLTGPCAYTLHSNLIPSTDGTNGLLWLVAYISQTGHQCFQTRFCHPTVGNFEVSPNVALLILKKWHVACH